MASDFPAHAVFSGASYTASVALFIRWHVMTTSVPKGSLRASNAILAGSIGLAVLGTCIALDGLGFDWFRSQPLGAYIGLIVCLAVLGWLWDSGTQESALPAPQVSSTPHEAVQSSATRPASPQPLPVIEASKEREFTTRTVDELLGFFRVHNGLQAEKLVAPFKGLWLQVEGSIIHLFTSSDGQPLAQIRDDPGNFIECRFDSRWADALARYKKVDWLRVRGRIAQTQIGGQLYLVECEPINEVGNAVDAQVVLASQVFGQPRKPGKP